MRTEQSKRARWARWRLLVGRQHQQLPVRLAAIHQITQANSMSCGGSYLFGGEGWSAGDSAQSEEMDLNDLCAFGLRRIAWLRLTR